MNRFKTFINEIDPRPGAGSPTRRARTSWSTTLHTTRSPSSCDNCATMDSSGKYHFLSRFYETSLAEIFG
jgi:hypothetical protein